MGTRNHHEVSSALFSLNIMPFEEMDHTADVKMRITAPDFTSLLSESAFALSHTLYGPYSKEPTEKTLELEVEGKNEIELIVNFLSELLFQMEVEYLVPQGFNLKVEGKSVSGTISGVEFKREKHAGGIGVKGISYSGISLTKTNTEYELIIIFDI